MILSLEEWVPAYTQRSKHLGDLEVLADSFFFLTRKRNFIFYLFSYPFICGKINPLFIVCVFMHTCAHMHVGIPSLLQPVGLGAQA